MPNALNTGYGQTGDTDTDAAQSSVLTEARKRYDVAIEHEDRNWELAVDDMRAATGDIWPEKARLIREAEGRPCISINKMGQFTRQVTGDMRLNRMAIKVNPVDDIADPKMARIVQGLVRHIEVTSRAQIAYVQAGKNVALCGMGAWRIVTEYVSDDAFEQQIKIRRIENPFAVVWDPGAHEYTREDANYCFVTSEMPLADFKAAFPNAKISDFEDFKAQVWYGAESWVTAERVRIAEYWCKKRKEKIIGRTATGATLDITDLREDQYALAGVVDWRRIVGYEIVQYLINGAEILDGPNIWPGKFIPIVPVWGEEINLGDRTYRHGMVRFAKDSQQMYNYAISQAIETTALSPRAPVVATVDQMRGQETNWASVNIKPLPYLLYNADPKAPGSPQRLAPPTLDGASLTLAQTAEKDMQTTIGVYNASLGGPSPETSGKAIIARDRQQDVGTFEYLDNLALSISYCGTILVDLIPKIYDTERVVRILGEDDSVEVVKINQEIIDPATLQMTTVNDLSVGRYDVVVETGPSFSTKRQEAAESLMEFMRVAPEAGKLIVDIIAKNMNWPGAEQVSNRLKKMLPPDIDKEPEEGVPEEPPPPPPEVIAAMEQAQREDQQNQAKFAVEMEKIALEKEGNQIERQRIEADKLKTIMEFQKARGEAMANGIAVADVDGSGAIGGSPFDQVAQAIASMAAAQAQTGQMMAALAGSLQNLAATQPQTAQSMNDALAAFVAQQAQRDAKQEQQIVALAAAMAAPRSKTISGKLPSGSFEATVTDEGIGAILSRPMGSA